MYMVKVYTGIKIKFKIGITNTLYKIKILTIHVIYSTQFWQYLTDNSKL